MEPAHGLAFALFLQHSGRPLWPLCRPYQPPQPDCLVLRRLERCHGLCGMAVGFWSLTAARVGVAVGEAGSSTAASTTMIADVYSPSSAAEP